MHQTIYDSSHEQVRLFYPPRVVNILLARGVPGVLATGYDASAIPQAYARLPRCEKPASGGDLTRAIGRVLAKAGTS